MSRRVVKKIELTSKIIAAAEGILREEGIKGLKARDITNRAGCSLGSLYTVFKDIDAVVMTLNSNTLVLLERSLSDATRRVENDREMLEVMAIAYADFAIENQNAWVALFEHRMPDGKQEPQWHKEEFHRLISMIVIALRYAMRGCDQDVAETRARTYFAALHGVVSLSLRGRFIGVSRAALYSELKHLVQLFA